MKKHTGIKLGYFLTFLPAVIENIGTEVSWPGDNMIFLVLENSMSIKLKVDLSELKFWME